MCNCRENIMHVYYYFKESEEMEKCIDGYTHKFIYMGADKKIERGSDFNSIYKRTDTFYCEKCLHYEYKVREESSRNKPDWYGD